MTISGVTFTGESAPVAPDTVTVLSGASFVLSRSNGDIDTQAPLGFFGHDSRLISGWALDIDGVRPQSLTHYLEAPWRCHFLARLFDDDHRLLVERARYVDEAMREDIVVHNLDRRAVGATVRLQVRADFASLFAVKESRVDHSAAALVDLKGDGIHLSRPTSDGRPGRIQVLIRAVGATASEDGLTFQVQLPPRGTWKASVHVQPVVDGHAVPPEFPDGRRVTEAAPAVRQRAWEESTAELRSSNADFDAILRQSRYDLGGLRIFDDGNPLPAVAAGSPWFMTLFGRDSLLTSYMTLSVDPSLAQGVLGALERRQGTKVVPETEEQPGRILHEIRTDDRDPNSPGGPRAYYGTADATPLFVALLGEFARWHGRCDTVANMLPAADRALEWIDTYGDRDGDGFVEYERATPDGLVNQGWKDSWDGINFADGTIAEAPIALCEVQGYVYAAFRARESIAAVYGDKDGAKHWGDRATRLKAEFNKRFWLPERGWFAVGLDRDKRPIDALASNMGHALWTGIVDDDLAPQVARQLVSPELFSGWGVRTLATTMGAYDPLSYHNGSVWPHDNALIAYGLMSHGFVSEGQKVAKGILDAAASVGRRLPELFGGFDRGDFPVPVPYPTACSPQAWASAAPIHLARALIGLEPAVDRGVLEARPRVPEALGTIALTGLPLAGGRVNLHARRGHVNASGVPSDLNWVVMD